MGQSGNQVPPPPSATASATPPPPPPSSSSSTSPPPPPAAGDSLTVPAPRSATPPTNEPSAAPSTAPQLPPSTAKPPPPMTDGGRFAPSPVASTWYRSEQQRYRSVYRRANPWYRRLARGLISLAVIGVLGIGVFVGVDRLQNYLGRDKLPAPGVESPDFRSTGFLITSSTPAPEIDGTLYIDVTTRAFQFVGSPGGAQRDLEIVSPDGVRVYLRNSLGPWRASTPDDQVAADVQLVIPHLLGVADSDDVLINRLRKGYVDLVDKREIGSSDVIKQYDMEIDTRQFADDWPLQWEQLLDTVVPDMVLSPALTMRMRINEDNVVMGIEDSVTNWKWQRLYYEPTSFVPLDPAAG